MVYVGLGIYVAIGLLFAGFMWANFATHCKKYLKVTLFGIIIALSWGYLPFAFALGMLGEVISQLIKKKESFIFKIPVALYIMMLEKMYQSLYGVRGGYLLGKEDEAAEQT